MFSFIFEDGTKFVDYDALRKKRSTKKLNNSKTRELSETHLCMLMRLLPCLLFVHKPNPFVFGFPRSFVQSSSKNPSPRIWSNVLRKMQIDDNVHFQSLFTAPLRKLWDLFEENDFEIRLAGGVVRDLLMGKKPNDVDLATTATPSQMRLMFQKANIPVFNLNGEKHGTVSVRVDDRENFEITTLRIDIETDGRHAEVCFTTDWMLDANRRDLTINSMFLDAKGIVYDYFNGFSDIEHKIVRFVGDAEIRIQEDYLRILRYFRFFGLVQPCPSVHDNNLLLVIAQNVHGLKQISGERIWVELKKIVVGPLAPEIIKTMNECKVIRYVGLDESIGDGELERFKEVYNNCKNYNPNPMTVISALFKDVGDLIVYHKRVHCSNDEKAIGRFILWKRDLQTEFRTLTQEQRIEKFVDMYFEMSNLDVKMLDKIGELAKYMGFGEVVELVKTRVEEIGEFPVNGNMLAAHGLEKGPNYKHVLEELKKLWIASKYKLSCSELLAQLEQVCDHLKRTRKAPLDGKSKRKMKRLSDLNQPIL